MRIWSLRLSMSILIRQDDPEVYAWTTISGIHTDCVAIKSCTNTLNRNYFERTLFNIIFCGVSIYIYCGIQYMYMYMYLHNVGILKTQNAWNVVTGNMKLSIWNCFVFLKRMFLFGTFQPFCDCKGQNQSKCWHTCQGISSALNPLMTARVKISQNVDIRVLAKVHVYLVHLTLLWLQGSKSVKMLIYLPRYMYI